VSAVPDDLSSGGADVGELLKLLSENVPALIAYYDALSLRCIFANNRYASTFGLTNETIIGRPLHEVIGEEATRRIRPHMDAVLRAAPQCHLRA
jgi:PAS domain-containing protein